MKLLEKILVPIDINIDSKEQINTAIKIAKLSDSEIFILYVLPEEGLKGAIKDLVFSSATKALDKIKNVFVKEGITVCEPVIKYGKPVDKILKMAAKEDVNLILTGSGSKKEEKKIKRGYTAEKLMRQSKKPVWVVKSDKANKLKNILCPVDFSEHSKCALKTAILLSKFFNARLTILGVYEEYANYSPRFTMDIETENAHRLKQFEREMEEFIKEFDLIGINHNIEIEAGSAHVEILKTIEENDHDLLVMGTHGRSGIKRFVIGSVTEKVTREVPCSFITTKTEVVFNVQCDNEVNEIETHYKIANDLFKNGNYNDAIGQYLICLQINGMHIPSLFKLSETFRIIDDSAKAKYYGDMANDVLTKLWDDGIAKDIKKYYTSGNQ